MLIDFAGGRFESLCDPAAAFRLWQMHEIRADRAAIDAAGFLGGFAGQSIQIRMLQRLKQAQGVESRLQVAPAAESVENTLALFVVGHSREDAGRGFLGRLRRSCRAIFFQCCTVCHKSSSMNLLFCHRRQMVACRAPVVPILQAGCTIGYCCRLRA